MKKDKKFGNEIGFISIIFFHMISFVLAQNEPDIGLKTIPSSTDTSGLNAYLCTAIKNNPSIRAQTYQWQSEIKKIDVVHGLPDPRIQGGYLVKKMKTNLIPQEEWRIGFSQMIPWPGKIMVRGQMQSSMVDAAYQKLQNVKADILFQVKSVYYDYYFLTRNIVITQQNLALVSQEEKVILNRYRTATAGHSDLIRTQIEKIEMEDHLKTLEAHKTPLIVQFGAILGIPINGIEVPETLDFIPLKMDSAAWRAVIMENNPDLKELQAMNESARKSLAMARLDWAPDLELGAEYMKMGFTGNTPYVHEMENIMHTMRVMGSISIPLWGYKQVAGVKSADLTRIEFEKRVEDMQNRLSFEFESAWTDLKDAERRVSLYHDRLIPLGLESLRATQKAYIGDEVEFMSLVEAHRRLLEFQLKFEDNLIQYVKAVATLEKMAGRTQ